MSICLMNKLSDIFLQAVNDTGKFGRRNPNYPNEDIQLLLIWKEK